MENSEHCNDIIKIINLRAKYSRLFDCRQWGQLESLMTDDIIFERLFPQREDGSQEVAERLQGKTEMVRTRRQATEQVITCHHAILPEITLHGAEAANGIWAFRTSASSRAEPQKKIFESCGYYYDSYTKVGDRWLFSKIRIETHFSG